MNAADAPELACSNKCKTKVIVNVKSLKPKQHKINKKCERKSRCNRKNKDPEETRDVKIILNKRTTKNIEKNYNQRNGDGGARRRGPPPALKTSLGPL